MRMAVVGASRLTEHEERDIRQHLAFIFKQLMDEYEDLTIISGGAKGVDSIAEELAKQMGIPTTIFRPEVEEWDPTSGMIGYKSRNLQIVNECDELYCFPCAIRDTPCYHCKTGKHQVSGACWTMHRAMTAGKPIHLIEPIIR